MARHATILDKLRREPGMELGRMDDIGGCRAVLRDLDEVQRLQARYANDPVTVRIKDYILEPKDDGYRAVHVIVKYRERRIEVQLRTRIQHEWAYTVDGVTARFGLDVKAGGGPRPYVIGLSPFQKRWRWRNMANQSVPNSWTVWLHSGKQSAPTCKDHADERLASSLLADF